MHNTSDHTTAIRKKTYVLVDAHFDEHDHITPLSIKETDGHTFEIDEVEDFR